MKKTLNLLTSMLVVNGSTVVTVACNKDNNIVVKSYLDWDHTEVNCKPDEDIYETEWGAGAIHKGVILYCAKNLEELEWKSLDKLKFVNKKYNLENTFIATNEKKEWGTLWNKKYPEEGYFIK